MANGQSGRVDSTFLKQLVEDKIARQRAAAEGSGSQTPVAEDNGGESLWETLQEGANDIVVNARRAALGFFGSIDKRLSGLDRFFGRLTNGSSRSPSSSYAPDMYLSAKPGTDPQDAINTYYWTNPRGLSPYSPAERFIQHMSPLTDGTISGIASGFAMNQPAEVRQLVQGLGNAADGLMLGASLGRAATTKVTLSQQSRPNMINPLSRTDPLYWPPYDGFLYSYPTTLPVRYRLDRYGDETGYFAAPAGTPIEMRSLDAVGRANPLNGYEVIKPIAVQAGPSSRYFGQQGGGLQFKFPKRISEVIPEYLKESAHDDRGAERIFPEIRHR